MRKARYMMSKAEYWQEKLLEKAMIPHSLGDLETLALRLAEGGVVSLSAPCLVVFCGDHGVVAEGVSHSDQRITRQMASLFVRGGGACGIFAGKLGVPLTVVDCGMLQGDDRGMLDFHLRYGTSDLLVMDAMRKDEALASLECGRKIVEGLSMDCLLVGEMGVGNSTSAACLLSRLLHVDPSLVVGTGSGQSLKDLEHKRDVVQRALLRSSATRPLDVLAAFGGFEIGMMAGSLIEAGRKGIPIVLDGVITLAAALLAKELGADTSLWIAGHRSSAPGSDLALRKLGLSPLLDLGMHLGEGTGALAAWPLVKLAVSLWEMPDFKEAGVTDSTKHLKELGII